MEEGGLVCHTDLDSCCENGLGQWYNPNGSVIGDGGGLYVSRGEKRISLKGRDNVEPAGGLYCCIVPTTEGVLASCARIDIGKFTHRQ